jgi:leucyl/phenylalanyl-tRNA--protein transferase
MQAAYVKLFDLGYAHCVEVYAQGELVGGIYGVAQGRNFFGESMFSRQANASKVAITYLVSQLKSMDFEFIDCQMDSPHLASLGSTLVPRAHFLQKITANNLIKNKLGKWELAPDANIW